MKSYNGKIIGVYSYYGIIKFNEYRNIKKEEITVNRKIPFLVSKDDKLSIGDEVEFHINPKKDISLNGPNGPQKIRIASDIKKVSSVKEKYIKKEEIFTSLNKKIVSDFYIKDINSLLVFIRKNNFNYSSVNEIIVILNNVKDKVTLEDLHNILAFDKRFKQFIMKWTLYCENEVKSEIIDLFIDKKEDLETITWNLKNKDSKSRKLVQPILERIWNKYLLKDIGDFRLHFKFKSDHSPYVETAPIDMILDECTIGDLLKIIKYLQKDYKYFDNLHWQEVRQYLYEIKRIRNISAHGNSLLSALIDNKENPNYLLAENAKIIEEDKFYKDTSKEDIIFSELQSIINLSLRGNIQNSREIALGWTEKLLNNPYLRSIFYLYLMVAKLNNNYKKAINFKNELKQLMGEKNKKVDFEKVILRIIIDDRLSDLNKKNILTYLLPSALNMFEYIKNNDLEYQGPYFKDIYEIKFCNQSYRVNLNLNADWHLKMLSNLSSDTTIAKKQKEEIWNEFGIFFNSNSNARETLINILEDNIEYEKNNNFSLEKIEGFQELKMLLIDILM